MVTKVSLLGMLSKKGEPQKEVDDEGADSDDAKEGHAEQTATNNETAGTKKSGESAAAAAAEATTTALTTTNGKGEEKEDKRPRGYRFKWVASLTDAARCRIGGVGRTVATKVGDEEFIVIRGDTPIPVAQAGGASTVRWGVKVLKSLKNNGGLINVGVLPAGELPVTGKKLILKGWFFYCCPAQLFSENTRGKPYGPRRNKEPYVSSGTTVWVTVDTTTGSLSFTLNDEGPLDTVPAFEGIPLDKPLVPAVSLCHGEDSVEVVF